MEPKRAEDEAEDREEEEEDVDEVGNEDKATVDVAEPLAEPEERDSRAEATGQDLSSSITSSSFTSTNHQGGVLFSPAFRVSLCALCQRGRLQGHTHQRLVTLLQSQLFIPAHWLQGEL